MIPIKGLSKGRYLEIGATIGHLSSTAISKTPSAVESLDYKNYFHQQFPTITPLNHAFQAHSGTTILGDEIVSISVHQQTYNPIASSGL